MKNDKIQGCQGGGKKVTLRCRWEGFEGEFPHFRNLTLSLKL